jgi:hypothetical protein
VPGQSASNLERYLSEAEECVRQAAIAVSAADKIAWLLLAEDWVKLARAARERDI